MSHVYAHVLCQEIYLLGFQTDRIERFCSYRVGFIPGLFAPRFRLASEHVSLTERAGLSPWTFRNVRRRGERGGDARRPVAGGVRVRIRGFEILLRVSRGTRVTMDIDIIEEDDNPMLHRTDVRFEVTHEEEIGRAHV